MCRLRISRYASGAPIPPNNGCSSAVSLPPPGFAPHGWINPIETLMTCVEGKNVGGSWKGVSFIPDQSSDWSGSVVNPASAVSAAKAFGEFTS